MGNQCQKLGDKFLEWYATERSEVTVRDRTYILRSFVAFVGDTTSVDDIRPCHIYSWLDSTGNRAASSRSSRIAFLASVFKWGVRRGYVKEFTLADLDKPRAVPRDCYVPSDRFHVLIDAARPRQLGELVSFMLETGCRPQEVMRLEAKDYGDSRFTLPISRSKGRKRKRVLFLTDRAESIANRLCKKFPNGPIFRNSRGTAWTAQSVAPHMRSIGNEIGVDGLCLTSLRHSFAHYRLTQGQSPEVVAKLLGHTDTTMIMKVYGHLDGSDFLAKAANSISLPGE